jgi:hypothetical protein
MHLLATTSASTLLQFYLSSGIGPGIGQNIGKFLTENLGNVTDPALIKVILQASQMASMFGIRTGAQLLTSKMTELSLPPELIKDEKLKNRYLSMVKTMSGNIASLGNFATFVANSSLTRELLDEISGNVQNRQAAELEALNAQAMTTQEGIEVTVQTYDLADLEDGQITLSDGQTITLTPEQQGVLNLQLGTNTFAESVALLESKGVDGFVIENGEPRFYFEAGENNSLFFEMDEVVVDPVDGSLDINLDYQINGQLPAGMTAADFSGLNLLDFGDGVNVNAVISTGTFDGFGDTVINIIPEGQDLPTGNYNFQNEDSFGVTLFTQDESGGVPHTEIYIRADYLAANEGNPDAIKALFQEEMLHSYGNLGETTDQDIQDLNGDGVITQE